MRMLEQPQKLLVQNVLALGVALAELAETVCVVGVKYFLVWLHSIISQEGEKI